MIMKICRKNFFYKIKIKKARNCNNTDLRSKYMIRENILTNHGMGRAENPDR